LRSSLLIADSYPRPMESQTVTGYSMEFGSLNRHLPSSSSYNSMIRVTINPTSPRTVPMVRLLKILFFTALSSTSVLSKQACRCTYGSECWPSNSEFQTLACHVSRPLIYPAPPATPCYNSAAGNCSDVHASWLNGIWRSDQPGAAEHTNWETYTFPNGTIEACYLNTTLGIPCQQGSVPVIGVDARTPEDIQAAVKFVAKHNLRLVIKGTG